MKTFNNEQLEKLSNYFIDVAKGLTLAALAVPAIDSTDSLFSSLRILLIAVIFIYASLRVIALKEVMV